MTRRARWLVALGLAALPACGRERVPTSATSGPTFVYLRGKDSPTADPAPATDGESALLITNVFDTLVQFKYGGFEVEPALATSWEVAPDRTSITFALREGVRFHDGTPCDGAAVALSFERQRDRTHALNFQDPDPAEKGLKAQYPYWGDLCGFVSRVTAVDAKTVRFEMSEPMPPFFLQVLAIFSNSIVSPAALAKGKGHVARHPVGTGAFRLASWAEGQEITLEANPDWWGGRPAIGRLVLKVATNPKGALLALENGQVHGIDMVDTHDVDRARANPALRLHEVSPGLSVCYLSLNNDVAPFDDVRVRRAAALAIDKARIVRSAYHGGAAPIATLVPPGMEGHLAIPDRKPDPKAARALLKEAGKEGVRVRLHYMGNPRPYVPDPDALATALREDLREAGFDVELKKEEWPAHLPLMQNGDHQMGILGWTPDVADADNYLYVLLDKEGARKPANNVSFYRSEAFHEKVAAARRSHDAAERRRLYEEAQRIAFDDVPLVPLVALPRRAVMAAKVAGFRLDPVSSPRFARVSIAP
jgi:peptide/nickel transport system substrate-binding protein